MILLISVLLTACTGNASPTAPAEQSRTASPSLQITASPTPIPRQTEDPPETATPEPTSPTTEQVRPHYTLTAELDYDQHYLMVDEQIEYTNLSPDYLPDLRLMVDPLYYPGAFVLKSISIGDGQPVDDYQIETGQIRVPLPAPLSPGERIRLALSYELIPAITYTLRRNTPHSLRLHRPANQSGRLVSVYSSLCRREGLAGAPSRLLR